MIDIAKVFLMHSKQLLRFIGSRVRTSDDARNILQDVFMRLIINNEENDISQVTAWLYRTARNRIIDFDRKREEQSLNDLVEYEAENLSDILANDSEVPDKDMLRNMIWDCLSEALDELPEEQKAVFIETEFNGVPYKIIAERTGIPIKTLLSRKHYAVVHLRERLKDIYDEILYDD